MRPPALTHPSAAIFLGDCLDVLAEIPDNSIDAIVTDPPYGLGFMGKAWDDLPPGLPWAEECLRVLKPGGHLLAFGGTRTWHRLAVAVEDAGFEVRDSIAWLYGSGFPKSLDVSKAIDKRRDEDLEPAAAVARFLVASMEEKGVTRADINRHFGHSTAGSGAAQQWTTTRTDRAIKPRVPTWEQWESLRDLLGFGPALDAEVWRLNGNKGKPGEGWTSREIVGQYEQSDPRLQGWAEMQGNERGTAKEIRGGATTPAAQQWQGWGTALKPAFEPIVVARKPLTGTVAANVLAHGTGALNIDGCRVHADDVPAGRTRHGGGIVGNGSSYEMPDSRGEQPAGRWPANVVLDGDAADALDEQSGTLAAGSRPRVRNADKNRTAYGEFAGQADLPGERMDAGGASRFFPTFREDSPSTPNAEGSTDVPASETDTPPALPTFRYQAKAPTRERPSYLAEDGSTVAHATVKPLALMRWLVRLVTPPGGTVLDTFAGSGATVEAAIEEGFYALGIEREETYLPLIQVRLDRVNVATETPAVRE